MNTKVTYATHDGPLGELLLVKRGGALAGVYFDGHRRGPAIEQGWRRAEDAFDAERAAVDAYFAGEEPRVEVDLSVGTPFQRRVWRALREIPRGETRMYGELAATLGRPGAARAVGAANAKNPVSILVPCHRVVGAGGRLSGYAGGVARKRWLLDHERAR